MSRTVNSDERRREIALAVYRVIARDGLEAASMREIAREAGCTTGSVTHHFADRRELLDYTVGMAIEDSMRRVVDVAGAGSLREALQEMLPLDEHRRQECSVWLAVVGAAGRDPELAASLSRRCGTANGRLAAELRARLVAMGRELSVAESDLLVDEVMSAVDGVAVYALSDPERYPPARQLLLVDRVLDRTGLL